MPTIKDVAKKAGVSVATASYAINGDERIKSETRQKVIDAAIELHYIPNGSAKNLKRQKRAKLPLKKLISKQIKKSRLN